ncbi:MAG: hypothetical protein U0T83_06380 [Bacteriovoracaceae bacterium]
MWIIFCYTILYVIIHKIYDSAHLLYPRLFLIPIFLLLYIFKGKIEEQLKSLSKNIKLELFLKYLFSILFIARITQFIIRLANQQHI